MSAIPETLETKAAQLREALACYARVLENDLAEVDRTDLPPAVEQSLANLTETAVDPSTPPATALATALKELYMDARRLEATYVEEARSQKQTDWDRVVAETAPIRNAAQRVHTAGDDRPDLPEQMCPAALVSMNAGSSPVTFSDRVAQYEAVAAHFEVAPDVVYHPGSGHDVSPSAAFPRSRVVYADVDAAAMADLDSAGYEAVATDATAHELETGADVIIFRNAGLVEEAIVERNLRPDGWVLANNHLESAEHVAAVEGLELVGVVPDDPDGDWTVETTELSVEQGAALDTYVFKNSNRLDG